MEEIPESKRVESASLLSTSVGSDATSYTDTQVTQDTSPVVTRQHFRILIILNVLVLLASFFESLIQLVTYLFVTAINPSVLVFANSMLPSIFITTVRFILGFIAIFQTQKFSVNKCLFAICSVLSILNFVQVGFFGGGLSILVAIVSPSWDTLLGALDDIYVFLLEIVLVSASIGLCYIYAKLDTSTSETTTRKNYILGLIILATQILVLAGGVLLIIGFGIWSALSGTFAFALISGLLPVILLVEINPICILIAQAVQMKTKSKIAASVTTAFSVHSLLTFGYALVVLVILFFMFLVSSSSIAATMLIVLTAVGSVVLVLLKLIPDLITLVCSLAIVASDE